MRASPPVKALPVAAQTTPNRICLPTAMVVTAATRPVSRAVRRDLEKVLILPALREYATMTKQEMTRMPISVLKTKRRMEWTVVWTAGHTLRKTLNVRVKRRKGRTRVYATIREKKVKAVFQMETKLATILPHRTPAEPKKSFPPYVAIHLPTLHYGYHGPHIKRTSATTRTQQRQTKVSWNFWMIQK